MGTPAAAVPSLSALTGAAQVVAAITQPDAAQGRGRHKASPPVKQAAEEWGIALAQPDNGPALLEAVTSFGFDVGVVVAYGRLLDAPVLEAAPYGFLNVHFSLLPRWRGAAPVERAILAGDETTGVAIMRLDEGLDTGPVVAVREVEIADDDTGGLLTARLAHVGADLLIDTLADYVSGRRQPAPQISGGATPAPRLTTVEAQLHGDLAVEQAERMVRAFNPKPGAWLTLDGDRLKVYAARLQENAIPPGTLAFSDATPLVGFRGGSLELATVQPAGQRMMSGAAWGNGRRHAPGVLGRPELK